MYAHDDKDPAGIELVLAATATALTLVAPNLRLECQGVELAAGLLLWNVLARASGPSAERGGFVGLRTPTGPSMTPGKSLLLRRRERGRLQ